MIASRDNVKILPTLTPALAATGTLTSDNTNVSDAETVTIGTHVYTFKIVFASGVLTSNNTNVSDGDTVTIGSVVYRFKNTIAQIGDIHIGASADASLTNLASAINGAGTPGTDYFTGTPVDANVSSSAVVSHALTLTAKVQGTAPNAVATTKVAVTLSWGAATLTGGYNLTANDVAISTTADLSLTNLVRAINGTGTAGTDYGTATPVNTDVTAAAVASHATVLTAIVVSAAGNTIATTETSAHLSFADTTLDGGNGGATLAMTLDQAATFNSESFHVGSFTEMIAFLNVYTHAGTTPTLDVKFQYSPDQSTWIDSGDAFTQVTITNSLTLKKLTANFGKYMRAVITVGGTTPQYKFDLILWAKA